MICFFHNFFSWGTETERSYHDFQPSGRSYRDPSARVGGLHSDKKDDKTGLNIYCVMIYPESINHSITHVYLK